MPLVEKSDYLLAKGPDGKRVWIHKVTGEIRTSLPTSDIPPPPISEAIPAPPEVAKPPPPAPALIKNDNGRLIAQQSDYLLAKDPDGKRVWIHKVTGEIRSSLPAPETSPTVVETTLVPNPPCNMPTLPSASAPVYSMTSMPGQAPLGVPVLAMPSRTPSIGVFGMETLDTKDGGLLAGVDLSVLSSKHLIDEDYELMAGRLSAEDYNISIRRNTSQKTENVAAATVAAAMAAQAGANAALLGTTTALGATSVPVVGLGGLGLVPGMPPMAGIDTSMFTMPIHLPPLQTPIIDTSALMSHISPPAMPPSIDTSVLLPPPPPSVDTSALMAGIAGNAESISNLDPAILAKAQKTIEAAEDNADTGNEGMDLAMAQQLMQLNRFYLQQRVFDTQKMVASGEMPTRFKEGFRPMQLCKQFMKSASCVRGDTCSYAHTYEELHPMSPELPGAQSAKAVEALADEELAVDIPEPSMRMQRKRAMCQRLTRGGCLLGKKCPFAHSDAELGTVALAITDRVKTQLCKFFEQGKCVYGKYCVNAHGMNEIGKPKPDYLCPPAKQSKEGDDKDKDRDRDKDKDRDKEKDRKT